MDLSSLRVIAAFALGGCGLTARISQSDEEEPESLPPTAGQLPRQLVWAVYGPRRDFAGFQRFGNGTDGALARMPCSTATTRIVAAQMGVRIRVTAAWECARALSTARAHGGQREKACCSPAAMARAQPPVLP